MKERVCKDDQIRLIMECRQSRRSDYQWHEKWYVYPAKKHSMRRTINVAEKEKCIFVIFKL